MNDSEMKILRVEEWFRDKNEMFIRKVNIYILRIIIKEKWDFSFTNVRYDFITGTMKNMQRSEGLEERRSRGM